MRQIVFTAAGIESEGGVHSLHVEGGAVDRKGRGEEGRALGEGGGVGGLSLIVETVQVTHELD